MRKEYFKLYFIFLKQRNQPLILTKDIQSFKNKHQPQLNQTTRPTGEEIKPAKQTSPRQKGIQHPKDTTNRKTIIKQQHDNDGGE